MKAALILLAAGDSRRFGGNKLLHEFRGKPMYRYIVEEVEKLPQDIFEKKLVVTQYEEIGRDLKDFGYEVVENHESCLGISHSIHLALGRLTKDLACCFAVCDQPYLQADTIKKLLDGYAASGCGLACLSNRGELGNPAVFSPEYRQELLALEGDIGGRRVIRKHMQDLYLCEVDDGLELVDIDVKQGAETL